MKKTYFQYESNISENINRKKIFQTQYEYSEKIVDINNLLNRVKIDKKNEFRQKIIFFGSAIAILVFTGFLL